MTSERVLTPADAVTKAAPLMLFVGADKGGTGKTMMARTLIDYCAARSVNLRVIDSQVPFGALKRFHPQAELIDIGETQGQMKLFAKSPADVVLVDMRAGVLASTLTALGDLGFLEDAKAGKRRYGVIHILGPSKASLDEIGPTEAALKGGAVHVLVKNCANDERFEWGVGALESYFKSEDVARAVLTVPHLDGTAREAVEAKGVSFAAFAADEDGNDLILCRRVRKWLRDVHGEFDKAGIGRLVAS